MGGAKHLRELDERPLLDRACEWSTGQSDKVALAARNDSKLADHGLPLLVDRHRDIGPISALDSAFNFAQSEGCGHVLMIGCDQPFLPPDLVSRLFAVIGNAGAAIPVSGEREQPMATLWRVNPAELVSYLGAGGQSLRGFAHQVGSAIVPWPAAEGVDPFFNVNDRAALAEAESWLRKGAQ